MVELDLSWNNLERIPLQSMHDLNLMRRFSMRGNPLKQLDETTFGYLAKTTGSAGSHKTKPSPISIAGLDAKTNTLNIGFNLNSPDLDLNQLVAFVQSQYNAKQSSTSGNAKLSPISAKQVNLLRRFIETYPSLAKYLAASNSSVSQLSSKDQLIVQSPILFALKLLIRMDSNLQSSMSSKAKSFAGAESEDPMNLVGDQDPDAVGDNMGEGIEIGDLNGIDLETIDESDGAELETETGSKPSELDEIQANSIAEGSTNANDLTAQTNRADADKRAMFKPMALLWKHLQELDFGQCQLTYIKWTTFEHLNELKRLFLDGNLLR